MKQALHPNRDFLRAMIVRIFHNDISHQRDFAHEQMSVMTSCLQNLSFSICNFNFLFHSGKNPVISVSEKAEEKKRNIINKHRKKEGLEHLKEPPGHLPREKGHIYSFIVILLTVFPSFNLPVEGCIINKETN